MTNKLNSSVNKITLAHGAGGRQMQSFIGEYIISKLKNGLLETLDDSAVLTNNTSAKRLAMTTDSYVVNPLFFPGGDIGRLAISGTVNDITTSGARPVALSLAFIIEEGTNLEIIKKVIDSLAATAQEAGVKIVTGDTKVVEKGHGDGLYINTCGIGFIENNQRRISSHNAETGDVVMVTGNLGQHEIALMRARQSFDFQTNVESDVAPLNKKMHQVLDELPDNEIHAIKDPTRGGITGALCEISDHSECAIRLYENSIPFGQEVRAVCELIGYDPLYLVSEGRFVIVGKESSFEIIKKYFGKEAAIIGKVEKSFKQGGDKVSEQSTQNSTLSGNSTISRKGVFLETTSGGLRLLKPLETLQLPRIC